ncbi:TetR/AcrR family transcriptional regulator [Enterococcus pallens]|nr:TetR/AcrR family transcriptional regulator [Enterococcus pallens]
MSKTMYQKILETAEQLFMNQGYEATSTRQIADALGITQPNLYYHFKKKEDIYVAVMRALAEEVGQQLRQLAKENESTLTEKLTEMMVYLRQRHPFDFYMMMHDMHYALSKESAEELYLLWQQSYEAPFIEVLKKEGVALRSEIQVELAVKQLFILLAAYLQPETYDKQGNSFPAAIDMFLYGIVKK